MIGQYNTIPVGIEIPFYYFNYPLDVDLPKITKRVRNTWQSDKSDPQNYKVEPGVHPINSDNFPYIIRNRYKCSGTPVDVLAIIKSSVSNTKHRQVLRKTWMNPTLYKLSGFKFTGVFLLGVNTEKYSQASLKEEQERYGDLVQLDFKDTYYNNTYKLMSGFRWAIENCPKARHVFFTDDDYFVNVWKLWEFSEIQNLANIKALVGYIRSAEQPYRNPIGLYRKWYVSLEQYPFKYYAPYALAGSIVVNMDTITDLYIGMHFTRFLSFDDVYLGIVAYKLNIPTLHSPLFVSVDIPDRTTFSKVEIISSHMVGDTVALDEAWRYFLSGFSWRYSLLRKKK